jgi:hypothetical protein
LSTAVQEAPVAEEKPFIRHEGDKGILKLMGADVTDSVLIDEYFEYRSTFGGQPGPLDRATLHRFAVEQNRRKAKGVKPKG